MESRGYLWILLVFTGLRCCHPYNISTYEVAPFFVSDGTGKSFSGFSVDLMAAISSKANIIDYREWLITSKDDVVPALIQDQQSSHTRAELALGPITAIGWEEENGKTVPTLLPHTELLENVTFQVLYKVPEKTQYTYPIDIFVVLLPYTGMVWLIFFLCYAWGGLSFYLISRYTPRSLGNDDGLCRSTQGRLLADSFWFVTRAFAYQASITEPKSHAARVLTAFWWFFCMDSCFLYFAALVTQFPTYTTAPLSTDKYLMHFTDINSLVQQKVTKYGTVKGSFTHQFFERANDKFFQDMELQMRSENVDSVESGIDRAMNEDFAFITETPFVEYYTRKTSKDSECSLFAVGDPFQIPALLNGDSLSLSHSYMVPFKNGPLGLSGNVGRISIITAIQQMKKDGVIDELYSKWFRPQPPCNAPGPQDIASLSDSTYQNIGVPPVQHQVEAFIYAGPVLIFFGGTIAAFIVAFVECRMHSRRKEPIDDMLPTKPLQQDQPVDL